MKTDKIIKELELNYGYEFSKKETANKHQFDWLKDMIKDVAEIVTKNCTLQRVSKQRELLIAFHKKLDIYTEDMKDGIAKMDVDNFLSNL